MFIALVASTEAALRVPPPGVVRVLFVGDSITYGTTHVDQGKIFTQIVDAGCPPSCITR